MNKRELVEKIAKNSELSNPKAEAVVNATLEAITSTLKEGGQVALPGFGSFQVKERAARTGRNPRTGEAMEIAASKLPTFKAGKKLKEALN